ncbi:MAG: thiamine-phosphate kinase [Hydrogenophaga sp.]|uniref:thiamine-phosphate kinase n=1 Tax=Hydrogenophaga sp. TaxID=1904254 RepID=UPI003D104A0D
MGEFELIRRHFQRPGVQLPADVSLGVGDDGALLRPRPGHELAVSTDMLVQDRHFFASVDPAALGHKALAVNLSDLAAMGAVPLGFTLALALPEADDAWLSAFARGLFALADANTCPLVGGDTTRGPLNICITVFGQVRTGRALRRSAAHAGDDLYVSGRTGEARLALEHQRGTDWASAATGVHLRDRLERPSPRNALGVALASVDGAHAAIDLSDGLVGDLGHILAASGVGAELDVALLPVAPEIAALPEAHRLECLLAGGDDYELLFTAAPAARDAVLAAAVTSQTPVTRIGRITEGNGLRLRGAKGRPLSLRVQGFDHFA